MKIILLKDVKNLGKANEIIEVNDGYAKNFLIAKNLASQYNQVSLHQLKERIDDAKKNEQSKIDDAIKLKSLLENKTLTFYIKANHGLSIGYITNKIIMDELNREQKIVTKYMFGSSYKLGLGAHYIVLNLYKEVKAEVNIIVNEQK